jgi:hypothetical protein
MKNSILITIFLGAIVLIFAEGCGAPDDGKVLNEIPVEEQIEYGVIAAQIVHNAKVGLLQSLTTAITTRRTAGAVAFCNTKAIRLTDSLGGAQGVRIKRVSDRPRNPVNRANKREEALIEAYKEKHSYAQELNPVIGEIDGKIVAYFAIELNGMCLQCHGRPDKEITPDVVKTIDRLYPSDKAKYYTDRDIRGMWVVTMDKPAG